jgi:glycosyltransferase involved in cell wall biosynthesis
LRIGLLIYGSLQTTSGGYVYDRKLVEHLRCKGDKVWVISLPWRSYAQHLGDNLSFSLLRQLERLPLDILLQDELNHPSLFLLNRWLRTRTGYLIISIVHHLRSSEARSTWQNRFYRCVEHHYLLTVDGFVFNSQTTRSVVEKLVGQKRPAVVAYPATSLRPDITEDEIAARVMQPGPLRIVFLGNVIPRKGLHTLLDALEQLPRDEWSLTVVGNLSVDKSYVRTIHRQVARSGLAKQVLFLGPISDIDLNIWLKENHLLVVPSSYEGFGIVYLEGMGFGLPAIASTAGAAREIINHGRNGFLMELEDTSALAQHLHQLSQDRKQLLAMSLEARRCYLSHPTWDVTAERIRMFLQTIVEK